MEWQFGLTIVLAVIMTIVIPALTRENKRVTSELNEKSLCSCFICFVETFTIAGITLIPVFGVWIAGGTTYKLYSSFKRDTYYFLLDPLSGINERVTSQLSGRESLNPVNLLHALIFIVLAVIIGSVGWIVGTGTRTFIDNSMCQN